MSSINKVILIGHLGADPELRYLADGSPVATVNLATSESWKDKTTGQKQEKTEWHRLVFFRRVAEVAGQYLKKGALVFVEGKLQTRKWTDASGTERYTTEIVVGDMKMLGKKAEGAASAPSQAPARPVSRPASPPGVAAYEPASAGDFDDDIPFVQSGYVQPSTEIAAAKRLARSSDVRVAW